MDYSLILNQSAKYLSFSQLKILAYCGRFRSIFIYCKNIEDNPLIYRNQHANDVYDVEFISSVASWVTAKRFTEMIPSELKRFRNTKKAMPMFAMVMLLPRLFVKRYEIFRYIESIGEKTLGRHMYEYYKQVNNTESMRILCESKKYSVSKLIDMLKIYSLNLNGVKFCETISIHYPKISANLFTEFPGDCIVPIVAKIKNPKNIGRLNEISRYGLVKWAIKYKNIKLLKKILIECKTPYLTKDPLFHISLSDDHDDFVKNILLDIINNEYFPHPILYDMILSTGNSFLISYLSSRIIVPSDYRFKGCIGCGMTLSVLTTLFENKYLNVVHLYEIIKLDGCKNKKISIEIWKYILDKLITFPSANKKYNAILGLTLSGITNLAIAYDDVELICCLRSNAITKSCLEENQAYIKYSKKDIKYMVDISDMME